MKKLLLLFVLVVMLGCGAKAQQTYAPVCPLNYDDVVNWLLPTNMTQHMTGSNLQMYISTVLGKMYFVKSGNGFPLDEKLYDNSYFYDYITEDGQLGWSDPGDVKQFINNGVKLAPRCIPNAGISGFNGTPIKLSGTTVKNDISTTYFVTKTDCTVTARNNLGYVYGDTWMVGPNNFGGSIGTADTRVVKYHWGCDSNYANCSTREELWLAAGYGWVEWKNYKLQNGVYVLQQDTLANNVAAGNVSPVQPCGDAPVQ